MASMNLAELAIQKKVISWMFVLVLGKFLDLDFCNPLKIKDLQE